MMFWFMMWFLSFTNVAQAEEAPTLYNLSMLNDWVATNSLNCTQDEATEAANSGSLDTNLVNNYGRLMWASRTVHDAYNELSQKQLVAAARNWERQYPVLKDDFYEFSERVDQIKVTLSSYAENMEYEVRTAQTKPVDVGSRRYRKTFGEQSSLCISHVASAERILISGQDLLVYAINDLTQAVRLSTLSDDVKDTLIDEINQRAGGMTLY